MHHEEIPTISGETITSKEDSDSMKYFTGLLGRIQGSHPTVPTRDTCFVHGIVFASQGMPSGEILSEASKDISKIVP